MSALSLQPPEGGPTATHQWHVAALRLLARPLSDRQYLSVLHWLYYRRWPDYAHPRTLQEHIQGHLLRRRDEALVTLADKVAVRDYVDACLGPGHCVPLLGAWSRADDVPLESLPCPLVLKPSHLSGHVMLLAQHDPAATAARRERLRGWLLRDHSRVNREWFYARVPRRIVAEPLLRDAAGRVPADTKAYVIGGRVRYFQVDCGRFTRPTRNLYGPDWSLLPVRTTLPRHRPDPKPAALTALVAMAERLARPFEFLRVDFYLLPDRVLVGELTSSPGAGIGRFYPAAFGEAMAAHWVLGRSGAELSA